MFPKDRLGSPPQSTPLSWVNFYFQKLYFLDTKEASPWLSASVHELNLTSGESILLTINGSKGFSLTVKVAKEGHCFISSPRSNRRAIFRLARKGLARAHGMGQSMKAQPP